jgi:hypothetical protein
VIYRSVSYGVTGRYSAVDNALRHVKNRYVYQLDITNAYASLPFDRLARILHAEEPRLGTLSDIFMFLNEYCAGFGGGLATGFPASPFLFDFYCDRMIDPVILGLHPDITYTRYLDDLTISSSKPITRSVRKSIRSVVERAGFMVNHAKSRVTDRHERNVTITGVTITRRGEVRPTAKHLQRLHDLVTLKLEDMEDTHAHVLAGLVGMIEELLRIRPHIRISSEAVTLRHRAKRRIRQLAKRGAFGERSSVPAPFDPRYLDDISAHIPVSEVIRHYRPDTEFKEKGGELYALCLFHQEKTPSFTISDRKRFYHCFGCGSHGDIFRFVMEEEKCGFREAVHLLVKRYGEPPDARILYEKENLWLF